jgi:hypothetical protein
MRILVGLTEIFKAAATLDVIAPRAFTAGIEGEG